jgi:hypothetical protein
MSIPRFNAEASIYQTNDSYRRITNGPATGRPLVYPSLFRIPFPHLPIGGGINWGCYEICAQGCAFTQNFQACQRNCLNQCTYEFPLLGF